MITRLVLALMASFALAGAAQAGEKPIYAPAPAWVKPAPDPDPAKLGDDAPVVLVMDLQQRLSDGQVWAYAEQATRVATPELLSEVGTVNVAWQPDAGDLIVHRAEILRGADRIDLLAGKEPFEILRREQQLERRHLDGMLTATLAVEGLRLGDVLRISFSVTRKDPALGGNMQSVLPLVAAPVRASFGRARLSWPTGAKVRWKAHVEGVAPTVKRSGGFDEVEFALPLAKLPEMPTDAPLRFRPVPLVDVTSFADWSAVSATMAPLYATEGLIAKDEALAGEVERIAKQSDDPRVRAALALRFVQDEIRYLFRGMDGGNYVPQSPAETWALRYGDCKAKSLLLLAMLRELGIEAEPVLASTQLGGIVPQRLPMPGAFDHVIVRATIGGESLWLDGTDGGTRLADIADTPVFLHVLPVRAAGAGLIELPLRPKGRPDVELAVEFDQSAGLGFPTPYTFTLSSGGQLAGMLRLVSSQANKEQLSDLVQGTVAEHLGETMVFDRSVSYDPESGRATIKASGISTTAWRMREERFRLALDRTVSKVEFAPDRARPAWQKIPVTVGGPSRFALDVRMRLPADVAGIALEGDAELDASLAGSRFRRTSRIADGWIVVHEEVEDEGGEMAAEALPAERARLALAQSRLLEAVAPADYPPRWQQVATAKRAGAFAAILKAYGRAIADDPDSALPYLNRAAFNAGIFEWRQAIADVTRAIEIEPSAELYQQRAGYWSQLGDTAKALADVGEAGKLDPSSVSVTGQLVGLYAEMKKHDEALSILDERIAAGGKQKQSFLALRADVLGQAGRVEEALAAIDAAVAASPGNPSLLNQRCWLKGTLNVALDTALKDCTKSIELAESPAAALDSRAMVYFRMDRFDDALADLDAALELAPGMPASLYLRGVISQRKGKAEAARQDLDAARTMSPQIDRQYLRYGIRP